MYIQLIKKKKSHEFYAIKNLQHIYFQLINATFKTLMQLPFIRFLI